MPSDTTHQQISTNMVGTQSIASIKAPSLRSGEGVGGGDTSQLISAKAPALQNNVRNGCTKKLPLALIQFALLILILSACGTPEPPTATEPPIATLETVSRPQSTWGQVELLAQVEQLEAPDFTLTATDRIATWTGVRDGRVNHFALGITDQQQQLVLPTFYPQQQRILATSQGALKVWLDRNNSDTGLRLQASTLDFDGTVQIGIIPINDQRTRNFDIIGHTQREFRIVWSGGLGEITNLYLHQIDDAGRPIGGELLQVDGDHPALIQNTDGAIHLFWLRDNGRSVYHAPFDEIGAPTLLEVQRIASNNLAVTDTILHFDVGYDGQTIYLLWTIRRIDDTQIVMMSHGNLEEGTFTPAQPLTTENDNTIHWIQAPQQTQSPLPLVANTNQNLSIVWMINGEIQQTEVIADTGRLISRPNIDTASERLGVSWSMPTDAGYANLFYVERTRLP